MRECYICKSTSDLRPYGEGGKPICFDCAMATPKRKAEAQRQFGAHLDAIREPNVVLTEHGPVPASSVFGDRDA